MKQIVVVGAVAALAFAGLAETVSLEQAETAARAWARDGHAVGERLSSVVEDVQEVRFSDDGLPLYVADFAGGGFAVLTSDTVCEPVVFYSGSGAFPSEPEHPIRALMAAEGRRLAQAVAAGGEPKPLWSRLLAPSRPRLMAAASATLSDSEIRVAPLVKTHWRQDSFNGCTPGNKAGNIPSGYFPLGCGPTALTQVMYTLRWPQDEVEPFTCTQSPISWTDGTSEWPQFTAVGGTYDWDEMPLTHNEVRVNKEVRERMDKFGLDVAIAFATQWREKSAGVTAGAVELWHGPMALTNFFHYSNAQFLSNTDSPGSSALTSDKVIRAMKSNLDAHIPVILEVHGTPGGHEIIGDGYGYKDGKFYGHFNFGWGGDGDGWYVIPDIQDFSSVSGVMYNIFTTQPAGSSIASGRVLLSSAPVEGATVSAYDGDRLVGTATTDANGNYGLIIPPGEYDLVARKADQKGELRSVTLGRCSGYSSAKWNSSGYYSARVLPAEGIVCGNVCDADITMTVPEPGAVIAIPTGAAGLVYTGAAQVGVPEGVSYTVEGGSATDAGDHVATATLRSGYTWSDGTTGSKRVPWTIAKATLVATAQSAECEAGDAVPSFAIKVKGFVNGETAETAAWYVAPRATTTYTPDSPAGEYPITVAGGAAKNYAFAYRGATLTAAEPRTDWGTVFTEELLYHIIAHPEKHINETYTLDPAPSLTGTTSPKTLVPVTVGFLEFGDNATISTDNEGRLRITLSSNEDLLPWGHLTIVGDVPSDAQIVVVGQYPGALWFAPNVTVHGGVNRVTSIETVSTRIRQSMQTTSGSGTLYLDGSGKGIEFKSIAAETNADGKKISCNNGTAGTFVLSGNVTLSVKDTGAKPDYDILIDGERPETDADGNAWSSSGTDLHDFVSKAAVEQTHDVICGYDKQPALGLVAGYAGTEEALSGCKVYLFRSLKTTGTTAATGAYLGQNALLKYLRGQDSVVKDITGYRDEDIKYMAVFTTDDIGTFSETVALPEEDVFSFFAALSPDGKQVYIDKTRKIAATATTCVANPYGYSRNPSQGMIDFAGSVGWHATGPTEPWVEVDGQELTGAMDNTIADKWSFTPELGASYDYVEICFPDDFTDAQRANTTVYLKFGKDCPLPINSLKLNGAKLVIQATDEYSTDITSEYLDVLTADANGVIDLTQVTFKEESKKLTAEILYDIIANPQNHKNEKYDDAVYGDVVGFITFYDTTAIETNGKGQLVLTCSNTSAGFVPWLNGDNIPAGAQIIANCPLYFNPNGATLRGAEGKRTYIECAGIYVNGNKTYEGGLYALNLDGTEGPVCIKSTGTGSANKISGKFHLLGDKSSLIIEHGASGVCYRVYQGDDELTQELDPPNSSGKQAAATSAPVVYGTVIEEEGDDETYEGVTDPVVAIGKVGYASIQDALDAIGVQESKVGEIKVVKNLESVGFEIPADLDVALDMNFKTLTLSSSIVVRGALAIQNEGTVEAAAGFVGTALIVNYGTLDKPAKNLLIKGTKAPFAIACESGSTTTCSGDSIFGQIELAGGDFTWNHGGDTRSFGNISDLVVRSGFAGVGTVDLTEYALANLKLAYKTEDIGNGMRRLTANPTSPIKVGDAEYDTLADAVANAASGSTIEIWRSAEIDGVTVPAPKNYTLKIGDGKVLKLKTPIVVAARAMLTVTGTEGGVEPAAGFVGSSLFVNEGALGVNTGNQGCAFALRGTVDVKLVSNKTDSTFTTKNATFNGVVELAGGFSRFDVPGTGGSGYNNLTLVAGDGLDPATVTIWNTYAEQVQPPEGYVWDTSGKVDTNYHALMSDPEAAVVIEPAKDGEQTVVIKAETKAEAEKKAAEAIQAPDEAVVSKADYAAYFKTTATAKGDGTFDVKVELDPAVVTPEIATEAASGEEPVKVEPNEKGETAVAAKVTNVKPGLWYGYKVATELGGETDTFANDVGSFQQATSTGSLTLKSTPQKGKAAFFKIAVSPVRPKE